MPNRISQDKAQAIALEYCSNGRKKAKAMEAIGYKHSYAVSPHGLKITYNNVLVKAEIARLDRKIELKSDYTREKAEQELEEARAIAKTKKDASSMVSATRGKNKLYGLEIERHIVDVATGRRPPDADQARERIAERVKQLEQ